MQRGERSLLPVHHYYQSEKNNLRQGTQLTLQYMSVGWKGPSPAEFKRTVNFQNYL